MQWADTTQSYWGFSTSTGKTLMRYQRMNDSRIISPEKSTNMRMGSDVLCIKTCGFNWWFFVCSGISVVLIYTQGSPKVTISCFCLRIVLSDSSLAFFVICLFPMLLIERLGNRHADQTF